MSDDFPSVAMHGRERLFPIREVSRITGINPVTLRAWERRYGLLAPHRTDSGHRLYSMGDIETLRRVQGWLERGVSVSKVARLLMRSDDPPAGVRQVSQASVHELNDWQVRLRRAIRAFDEPSLERLYGQIYSSYPVAVAFEQLLMPIWQALALRQQTFGCTSEWLFLDRFLRGRLQLRLQMSGIHDPYRRVLVTALSGRCHELELMVAGLALTGADVDIRMLAVGQPLGELSLVCENLKPIGLVLFSSQPPTLELIPNLMRLIPSLGCTLMLAGEVAELAEDRLQGTPILSLGNSLASMPWRLRDSLVG